MLIVWILISQLAGLIGSFFTTPNLDNWYANLNKPSWNPPGYIFGPVWLTLYTLMGIAAYLVWQKKDLAPAKTALTVFLIHLVFNSLWSILFFGLQRLDLAFMEIILLLSLICLTFYLFYQVRSLAAWLLIPYLLWVSFASFLNYTIWQLNS